MRGRNAEPGFDATADDTRRAPGGTTSHATLPGASAVSKPALSIRRCGMNEPVPLVPIRASEHGESNQARGRRAGSRSVSASPGLSIRLLASEQDIEDTLTLTLAAHAESRHRDHPLDAERCRRFLTARFLADPVQYGFFVARHGERAVGMLTCHAQRLYFSDVTVVSCLAFYVLASCRRTLLGGRVALRLLGTSVGDEPQGGRVADPCDERDPYPADRSGAAPSGVSANRRELRNGIERGGNPMNSFEREEGRGGAGCHWSAGGGDARVRLLRLRGTFGGVPPLLRTPLVSGAAVGRGDVHTGGDARLRGRHTGTGIGITTRPTGAGTCGGARCCSGERGGTTTIMRTRGRGVIGRSGGSGTPGRRWCG